MQEQIIKYLKQNDVATTGTIAKVLGITYYRTNNILLNMVIEGKIQRKKIEGSKMYLYSIKKGETNATA